MAKKVKIDLTYSKDKLWWSTDGKVNWGIVGPNSPYTVIDPESEIEWVADKTIDSLTITPDNATVIDKPEGGQKDKKAKIKKSCKNGDHCKYDITIVMAKTGKTVTIDPDLFVCKPFTDECMSDD